MKVLSLTLSALLLLVPFGALAEDMPISYLVDRPTLLGNAPTGTVLTFELHLDSGCTSAVHSETIAVGDPDLLIEQVDLLRVQGGPRPPRVARLNLTLTNVLPQLSFFLRVTGPGISPIGRLCQPQPLFFTVSPPSFPTGLIVLQDEISCPSGFTQVSSYNDKFLVGSATAGITGGSNAHSHEVGTFTVSSHTHSFTTGTESDGRYLTANEPGAPFDRICGGDGSCPVKRWPHTHSGTTGASGPVTVTGTSAAADSRPEFKTIILCKKN